jgi:DNA protecting protein DprA
MIRYVIALNELGIKNNNILSLLQSYSSDIVDMFNNSSIFQERFELIPYYEYFSNKAAMDDALTKADLILSKNEELEIKTTYYTAETYPKELAKIQNPPAVLYYKGAEFSEISKNAIACAGTRKPTKRSYKAVNYLVPQWVNENCSIISGLACGVDKISHQACISAGGRTVAVLAHGLDTIYPKENVSLAERILLSDGILMSEYPVGTKADKFRFVNRNRLIVGMSKAVVIYECDEKGGTMHNVEYAAQQNKPIFCPALGDDSIEIQTGTKKLIDEHIATVIEQGRDIVSVLDALDVKISKPRMTNLEIKKIFLHSILSILDSSVVLDTTIQELRLSLKNTSSFYDDAINLINSGRLDIDALLNSLIFNNISSINKTLQFND